MSGFRLAVKLARVVSATNGATLSSYIGKDIQQCECTFAMSQHHIFTNQSGIYSRIFPFLSQCLVYSKL